MNFLQNTIITTLQAIKDRLEDADPDLAKRQIYFAAEQEVDADKKIDQDETAEQGVPDSVENHSTGSSDGKNEGSSLAPTPVGLCSSALAAPISTARSYLACAALETEEARQIKHLSLEFGDIALHYSKSAMSRAESTWVYEQSREYLASAQALGPMASQYLSAKIPDLSQLQLSPVAHLKSAVLSLEQCVIVKDSVAWLRAQAEWVQAQAKWIFSFDLAIVKNHLDYDEDGEVSLADLKSTALAVPEQAKKFSAEKAAYGLDQAYELKLKAYRRLIPVLQKELDGSSKEPESAAEE